MLVHLFAARMFLVDVARRLHHSGCVGPRAAHARVRQTAHPQAQLRRDVCRQPLGGRRSSERRPSTHVQSVRAAAGDADRNPLPGEGKYFVHRQQSLQPTDTTRKHATRGKPQPRRREQSIKQYVTEQKKLQSF